MENENKICANCSEIITGEGHDTMDGLVCDNCYENDYNECTCCGECYHNDDINWVDGDPYCPSCYEEHFTECEHCNEVVDRDYTTEVGDEIWCENCTECGAICCDYCGEYVPCDSAQNVGSDTYCLECVDNHTNACDRCGDLIREGEGYSVSTENGYSELWCDSCYDNHAYECTGCGEIYSEDAIHFDSDGDPYCQACYDENFGETDTSEILSYSEEHNTHFIPRKAENEKKEPLFYIGTELEIEGNGIKDEHTKKIAKNIPCVLAHDGSLTSRGFEIITQPLSFELFKELEPKFKEVYNYLISEGYKSHDVSNCGLHIHVTRPSEEVIDRIIFIMETYKEELQQFARRGSNTYSHWYSDNDYNKEKVKSLDMIKGIKDTRDRYYSLNLTNTKTIEFRIFKGTLNVNTYYASIELVYNLVKACMDLKKPLSSITWEAITKGVHCSKYVSDRGIFTNKVPKDMTKQLLKKYAKMQVLKNKITQILVDSIYTYKSNSSNLKKTKMLQGFNTNEIDNVISDLRHLSNIYSNVEEYTNNTIRYINQLQNPNVTTNDSQISSILNEIINYLGVDTASKDKLKAIRDNLNKKMGGEL